MKRAFLEYSSVVLQNKSGSVSKIGTATNSSFFEVGNSRRPGPGNRSRRDSRSNEASSRGCVPISGSVDVDGTGNRHGMR